MHSINGHHQKSQTAAMPEDSGRRESWSSSGDTTYYDAREQPGKAGSRYMTADEGDDDDFGHGALSGVETPQDLQAAHDRAMMMGRAGGAYDNTAYLHDNGNDTLKPTTGKLSKFKSKAKMRQPYHLTTETNVDSTTTAGEEDYDEEDVTDDDFGFKYRPAIAPPRPLQAAAGQTEATPSRQSALTLEDTLSMKRSHRGVEAAAAAAAAGIVGGSSGILLETNIDSELDDNSSIPSSYYPDTMRPASQQPPQQQLVQNGVVRGSLTRAQAMASLTANNNNSNSGSHLPAPVRVGAFLFNTAVKESEEGEEEDDEQTARSSGTATEEERGRGGWSQASSAMPTDLREETPRMATWSPRSPNSPSLTVIENGSGSGSGAGQPHTPLYNGRQGYQRHSPYKSPASTSVVSGYSQVPPAAPRQQQAIPPRMLARLDTDFEVSTDEGDFTETTPQDMAILEYSRALEEADRMQHVAGNYVFAQPPNSQFTNSVPEYINYTGRDSATIGSIGLRAKSMNTLNSSRNSLNGSASGKVLLTPGRARRESLRRSRLGLDPGGVYSIQITDDANPVLASGNSRTNFAMTPDLPEVQHHGPLRSSSAAAKTSRLRFPCENCCPNTPRKILLRGFLIAGICVCFVLLGVAVAVIVVTLRPKADTNA